MGLLETLRVSLRALDNNKLRTALTMLGIMIGVCVVILVVAIGQGASQRVTDTINALGTNLLSIRPGTTHLRLNAVTVKAAESSSTSTTGATTTAGTTSTNPLATNHMTLQDAELIAQRFPQTIDAVAPQVRGSIQVRLGDVDATTTLTGTTPAYGYVNNVQALYGRMFTDSEIDGRAKVCVVGATVADNLTGDANADLTGQTISINRLDFQIVGMLKPKGSGAFGQDQDDVVLVPITTAMIRVLNKQYIDMISLRCTTQAMMPLAQEQIATFLRNRHHLQPPFPDNDDFQIRNQTQIMQSQQSITTTMTTLLSIVAVVSLVVGGIGIMNIMLVSVTERTREIGIRKAVGATPRDVLLQFLIESSIISILGGLIGIGMGVVGATLLASLGGWNTIISATAVIAAVAVSAGVGIFFGIYPASKAAAMHPIDALRFE